MRRSTAPLNIPAPTRRPCRRLTRDTTEYKNRKDSLAGEAKALKALDASLTELDEPALRAAAETATAKRDAARGALEAAEKAVEAATREVAGAQR